MILLPRYPAPRAAVPALLDFGSTISPPLGGEDLRLDRLGNRYRVQVSWAPMRLDVARVFISRLQEAKSAGLRIPYPLVNVPQGSPGEPVVDGADQAGTTLAVRGLRPDYVLREGYWLSIENAAGQHYLHNNRSTQRIGASGEAELALWPMLRTDFADGATVHLAKPMIEGLPQGDETSWAIETGGMVQLSVEIRETA